MDLGSIPGGGTRWYTFTMSPEEKKLLEETAQLTKESNEILKKLYRSHIWGRVTHILYWVIIIGASIGAFYFIQPYIDTLRSFTGGDENGSSSLDALLGF